MPPGGRPANSRPAPRPQTTKPAIAAGDEPHVQGDRPSVYLAIGKTVNLGNFETVRVDYGERHIVNPGETIEDVRQRALESVSATAREMIDFVVQNFSS